MPHGNFSSLRSSRLEHDALVTARCQQVDLKHHEEATSLRDEWRKLRVSMPPSSARPCMEPRCDTADDGASTADAVMVAAVASAAAKLAERVRAKDAWLAEQRRLVDNQTALTDCLTARYSTSSGGSSERTQSDDEGNEDDVLAYCPDESYHSARGREQAGVEPEAVDAPVDEPLLQVRTPPMQPMSAVDSKPPVPHTPRASRAAGFGQSRRVRRVEQ